MVIITHRLLGIDSCPHHLCLVACVEVEEVVGVLTPFGSGVAQVFHVLLVELRLLLVAEVEEGDGWEVESGVGRVKEKQPRG